MIAAVPLDETKKEISPSFGRAPYLMMYDTETRKSEVIENTASFAEGGAGIKAAQLTLDHKAEALIAKSCGENAAKVLKAAHVKLYQAKGIDMKENLALLEEGKLPVLGRFHAGFHGGR